MLDAMEVLVATELVVALRALRFAERDPSGAGVRDLFGAAIEALPSGREDRVFGEDVETARELLHGLHDH
jgi:histidine ammonia-lyase